jgi:hypothetical protein
MNINEQLEKACRETLNKFASLDDGGYGDIRSKLEYCLGSYGYDGNPIGLYECARDSSGLLKEYKEKNPRKVSKKLIEFVDKTVANFEKMK